MNKFNASSDPIENYPIVITYTLHPFRYAGITYYGITNKNIKK